MNRRKFIAGLAIGSVAGRTWAEKHLQEKHGLERLLFVGTQTKPGDSKGIYTYRFYENSGELSRQELAAEIEMPTFIALAPDGKHLFAVSEAADFEGQKSGGVTSFVVHGPRLTRINSVLAGGTGTCYVSTDHSGRAVFCANYNSGSASSFHVDESGKLSEAISTFQYHGHGPVADRQQGPHAHRAMVSPDNRFILVNDLGLDCIHIYRLNSPTAKLTPNDPAQWWSAPGTGPRALRFHPNGKWAYCVDELDSSVQVLQWYPHNGSLAVVQKVDLTPNNYHGPTSTGCDIVITRAGDYAYAANRGYDCLVSFRVDPNTGRLTLLARTSSGGKTPRDLTLDPSERFVLAANQASDNIAVFARDPKTGLLAENGKSFPLSRPQCLLFA